MSPINTWVPRAHLVISIVLYAGVSHAQYRFPSDHLQLRAGGYVDHDGRTCAKDSNGNDIEKDCLEDWNCNRDSNASTYDKHGGWDIILGWTDKAKRTYKTGVPVVAPVDGVIPSDGWNDGCYDKCQTMANTDKGAPIDASSPDGGVTYESCGACGGGFGNYVKIRDRFGRTVILGHMRRDTVSAAMLAIPVEPDGSRKIHCANTQLGEIGSSGRSTTPHIHFEVHESAILGKASRVDPFAGPCNHFIDIVADGGTPDDTPTYTSYWSTQGPYDSFWVPLSQTYPGTECYSCVTEPGATWTSASDNRRRAFQRAYGYIQYRQDSQQALEPGHAEPQLGCPKYGAGSAATMATSRGAGWRAPTPGHPAPNPGGEADDFLHQPMLRRSPAPAVRVATCCELSGRGDMIVGREPRRGVAAQRRGTGGDRSERCAIYLSDHAA